MATDLRTVSGATNSEKLSNAAIAGGDYYVNGTPDFTLPTDVTINNRTFNLTGDATISGTVVINLKNFGTIDGTLVFDGIEFDIPYDADISDSIWSGSTINNSPGIWAITNNRTTSPTTAGFTIDGLTFNDSVGLIGQYDSIIVKNCVVNHTSGTSFPNMSLFSGGGSNHLFEYNVINGNRSYTEEAIVWYTARPDNDLPLHSPSGNIVRYNQCYNGREEMIGWDCTGETFPFTGHITEISGSDITIESDVSYSNPLSISDYTGLYLYFLNGSLAGETYLITDSNGMTVTLQGYSGGASVGDYVTPGALFHDNEWTDNEFDWDSLGQSPNGALPVACSLWGGSSHNLVARNTVTSGILPFSCVYVINAVGGAYYPCHYNTFEDNTVGTMSCANHFGVQSYLQNPTGPTAWLFTPYSIGHIIRGNTVTTSTSAEYVDRSEYGFEFVDTTFDYLKNYQIYNNTLDKWHEANNSPKILAVKDQIVLAPSMSVTASVLSPSFYGENPAAIFVIPQAGLTLYVNSVGMAGDRTLSAYRRWTGSAWSSDVVLKRYLNSAWQTIN